MKNNTDKTTMKTRLAVLSLIFISITTAALGYFQHLDYLPYIAVGLSIVTTFIAISTKPKSMDKDQFLQNSTPEPTKNTIVEELKPHSKSSAKESLVSNEQVNWEGISDPVTGMLNDLFFAGLVGTKVATARRRLWPVSIALLHVNFGSAVTDKSDENKAATEFAESIMSTIRDADVACRLSRKTFALILDDTDEDGGAWASERIQLAQARKGDARISKVSAGVASYPSHGIEPTEIIAKAREALEKAVNNADLPGLGLVIVVPQRPL